MTTAVAEQSAAATAAVADAVVDSEHLVRAVASGRRRNEVVPYRRVELRYVDLAAGRHLQVTSYDQTQAHVRNVALGEPAASVVAELVSTPYATWHVETTTETIRLHFSKKGRPLLHRGSATTQQVAAEVDRGHDRAKHRRLDEGDPLFAVLGMTSGDGRIKPSRRAKYRQVQDLLNALEPVVHDAVTSRPAQSADRPLHLVDLGCGNAYLTFAAFRYLTSVKQLPVRATGVDLKAQARAHNDDVAASLGVTGEVRFLEGSIRDAVVDDPDLVLALHACDTATDDAFARAVRWQAPVVLAAPCCHHDLQRQLSRTEPPSRYRLLTRHGILAQRFADVLTDALRAAVLRIVGYRVDVVEFVDPEHTPRNTLIRAVHTGAAPDVAVVDGYRALLEEWQVRPALAERLADLHPALGGTGGDLT
ncbi:MAG: SAM-dependent methyltransferase [uncultured Nocardioidaceae bacterium]|uniref:SAM-dependent methyltransferase n=1 Tax=uncultured Nocardioidaceae bacterium TaxID=253824 RepID=A0A6J4NB87_9ACTN|nr:MAG: SAM-dependent methyltransferase [uncultured Nocardioidaceae bacterium]